MQKLKLAIASLAFLFCLAPATPALAVDVFGGACRTAAAKQSSACQTTGGNPIAGPDGILNKVTRIVALVSGVAAVVIIIVAGIMYITAAGDANKAANARKTVIYAVLGLLVIILAQTIITFIINRI